MPLQYSRDGHVPVNLVQAGDVISPAAGGGGIVARDT